MGEVEALLDRLRSGNGLSVEEIALLGPASIPAIRPLALSSDPRVRRSALIALSELRATGCEDVYQHAILEADDDAVYIALEGLERVLEPRHEPALLAAYDARPEGTIRGAIARTLGTLEGRADFWAFKKRADAEQDEEAKEGVLFALARMGDGPARAEILRRLPGAKREFLERHFEYLKAPWLLKPLLPLLDDQEVLFDSRSLFHGQPGAPIPEAFRSSERVCDRVLGWVAAIAGRSFSFPVQRLVHYAPEQIEEVRAFLRSLP